MGTTNMKALRVLTGTHAGAQVQLTSGSYRIGGAEDADLCITDWTVDDVTLVVGEEGVTRLQSSNGDEVLVADFVAVPFGDVVFCVGPEDADWPRDLDLLAGLWKTAEPPIEAPAHDAAVASAADDANVANDGPARNDAPQAADSDAAGTDGAPRLNPVLALLAASGRLSGKLTWRTTVAALMCTVAVGVLGAVGTMFAGTQSSEAANVKFNPASLAREIDGALHRAGFADLHAMPGKDGVVVEGIVPQYKDSAKAQRIMDAIAPGKVRREYDVAQQDVSNIQQSLTGTGATVDYVGHGVFRVTGSVPSMATFRTLIAGVRADLDRNAKRIDIDVKEAELPTHDAQFTEVVATGGLRYAETPDGTKHLFASSEDEANN
ncbi:secretion protein SctD [Paraburkholderia sp. Ac-20342]|nr:secretion protein SctD [Paraburkholderia sp. Ac-20342]NIF54070.1 secretion protein SctD [Burkholderia sp. Ax-1724]NIF81723.1 secretion protein SctD [Paraburkholderia sp. Cy-641]